MGVYEDEVEVCTSEWVPMFTWGEYVYVYVHVYGRPCEIGAVCVRLCTTPTVRSRVCTTGNYD